MVQLGDQRRRRVQAKDGIHRVPRHQPQDQEHDHRHPEQDRHRDQQTLYDRLSHQSSTLISSEGSGPAFWSAGSIQYRWIWLLRKMYGASSATARTTSGYARLRTTGSPEYTNFSRARSIFGFLVRAKFHGDVE